MSESLDGAVLLYLLVGGALTLVFGALALALFRRAVARKMAATEHGVSLIAPVEQPRRPGAAPLTFRTETAGAATSGIDPSEPALRQLAAVHVSAGLAFGTVGAILLILLSGMELLPLRTAVVVSALAWPTVLALCLLVGPDRRLQGQIFLSYGVLVLTLCTATWLAGTLELEVRAVGDLTGIESSHLMLPGFVQPAFVWALYALPSLFLLLFLNRTVRTIGPPVLLFFFVMLLGTHVTLAVLQIPAVMALAVDVAIAVGLGGTAVFWGFVGLGLLAGGWAGWRAAAFVANLYATKWLSDLTLTVGAIWILQALVLASGLVREQGALGLAASALPFAAWLATLTAGQRLVANRAPASSARHLLFLRVFGFERRSRRFLDLLGPRWRLLGTIHLIAGPDLAPRTVEPVTFLQFVRGRLSELFLRTPEDLDERLKTLDRLPDPDGRFRTNQLFCSGEIWKAAVTRLMGEVSFVAMDLRGFGSERRGCIFELQTLLDRVSLNRVLLLIDDTTDHAALKELLQERWQMLDVQSPNMAASSAELLLLDTSSSETAIIRYLLSRVEPREKISPEPLSLLPVR